MIKTKAIFLSLVILLISSSLWAQDCCSKKSFRKHEFSVGVGLSKDVFSNLRIENIFSNIIDYIVGTEEKYYNTKVTNRSGFYLGYTYRFNQKWALGAVLFYKTYDNKRTRNEVKSTYKEDFYGLALEGSYIYLNKRVFRMYSLVGLGLYSYRQEWKHRENEIQERLKNNSTKLAYQISPLCMEIGTFIGLKLEYGYGYKGITSAGLYYRF